MREFKIFLNIHKRHLDLTLDLYSMDAIDQLRIYLAGCCGTVVLPDEAA